jgi:multicomponent Na+:H+ antiporter subunit B
VLGVLLLFRKQKQDEEDVNKRVQSLREDRIPPTDAIRVSMQGMVAVMIAFGLYVSTHGALTPGGGFQGGVILATAPLVVYLSGSVNQFQRIVRNPLLSLSESLGAAGYALIGIGALFAGANYLTNFLPLGTTGFVNSSGTIGTISVAVAFEVSGGVVLVMQSYLEEVLEAESQKS